VNPTATPDSGPKRDYYRHNFLSFLDSVHGLYSDILSDHERSYIGTLNELSTDAQCLYARLISRVGPLFRSDKVSYDEINDIPAAARELEQKVLLRIDGEYDAEFILKLLLKSEIVEMIESMGLSVETPAGLKKTELLETVLSTDDDGSISRYRTKLFTTYEPLELETLALFKLLFFGNYRQDLSEFIITDLGLITYEDYGLDRGARPFKDRRTVDERVSLHAMSEELYENLRELEPDDILEYAANLSEIVPDPAHDNQIARRYGRICADLGRQLERLGRYGEADEIYLRTDLPPTRERRARIHFTQGRYADAEEVCREIAIDPQNEEEADFAAGFLRKIARKTGGVVSQPEVPSTVFQDHDLAGTAPDSVELYALDGFLTSGCDGYFTENQLWNALFGLAFWDIIFLPIEGVFYNRYQRGPADLLTEQFYRRRAREIEERIESIAANRRWPRELIGRYDEKFGIACSLVNWKRVTREMVKRAVTRIPRGHLVAIFSRMCKDLRANSSGFPDLVLFPPRKLARKHSDAGGFALPADIGLPYVLVEVKGPGDHVQKNQKRWMACFAEHGVPCRVFRMSL
jgi:hypothetical protein